jgi:hypothetical protein
MGVERRTADVSPTRSPLSRSHELCERSRAARKAGAEPRIEADLETVLDSERPPLLRRLWVRSRF